jgi:hypothetical protein
MANLRKLLLALTVILVATITASAQTAPPFQCTASAAVPTMLRAEGMTELVGDIVLTCSGGTPTQVGRSVPRVNIEVFLNTPVMNITSRLVSSSYSEALLLIDDPVYPNQKPCTNPDSGCTQVGVYTSPTAPGRFGLDYGYRDTEIPVPGRDGANQEIKNIYQAKKAADNRLVWLGVPVDPPGSTSARILRIKNVRVNATALAGGAIPAPVVMAVSISGESTIPIYSPLQIVGYVQQGLSVSFPSKSFRQCEKQDKTPVGTIKFTEQFPTAFKQRSVGSDPATPAPQRDPAVVFYTTETGFYNPDLGGAGNTNGLNDAGKADHGTRLRVFFSDVPTGVTLYVSRTVSTASTTLQLVTTATDGSGAYSPVTGSDPLVPVTIVGGTGVAVWEVIATDSNKIESVEVTVAISYTPNLAANQPPPGTIKASASFAPVASASLATQQGLAVPIPRFLDTGSSRGIATINLCLTNLLFPFVTNQAGFDTGLAIANTSKDPFGTSTQAGACTLKFYGTTVGGGAPPADYATGVIAAGDHWTGLLSNLAPTFQGYIIAQCQFQYAHGFAFISDLGASKVSHGYLALVMDDPALPGRTTFKGETLGQ